MELEDAIHTALLTLREGFEGEMNGHNIEVGVVSKADGKFRLLTPEQIQDYLDEANQKENEWIYLLGIAQFASLGEERERWRERDVSDGEVGMMGDFFIAIRIVVVAVKID